MKLYKHSDMLRGWFVGAFEPTCRATKDFEVQYREYLPGHTDDHYHTHVTEINLVVSGKVTLQGKTLVKGDIFVLEPWEISNPEFLEPTGIVCVKFPSMNDKIAICRDPS
jgi:mannose-6-phosphate isomerase-like protein (cupin superfamily)